MGVDNKIRSSTSKITVVHQDWLKRGYAPVDNGKVVCPALELGSDQVIYTIPTDNVQPHCDNAPHIPGVRPRNLRQNVHAPDQYGFRGYYSRADTFVLLLFVHGHGCYC